MAKKRRIAIVSPTIDKCHGTERHVPECVSRLSAEFEIHLYSKQVADIDLSRVTWHRIPDIPGPHLVRYLWWFAANHLWRWWSTRDGRLAYDLVYSPGINCLDADVVIVYIVFSDYLPRVREGLSLRTNPVRSWPRLIHRRLYYRLISTLERRIYGRESLKLGAVSEKVSEDLRRRFGRANPVCVIYPGFDLDVFNPQARLGRRPEMRRQLGLAEEELVLLLIGNDWKNKGLTCLLEAASRLPDVPMKLLVVGRDDRRPFRILEEKLGVAGRLLYFDPSPDVMQFYAAADLYAGPSLHDSFALPPTEAMACGLPVIVSRTNGTAEVIADGTDGLVLEDPGDTEGLAQMIRRLYQDPGLRQRLGENAARTAGRYTWERHVDQMRALFEQAMAGNASKTAASRNS